MRPVLVATGVKREAATLNAPGLFVVPGGGDAAGLRAKLETEAPGACGIVSFGMAGALAEGLAIGDWVVGSHVSGAVAAECDADWAAALVASLPGARIGGVHADGRLIASADEKRVLSAAHGALAVDMESHVAAAVAAANGLPLAVVRCISDEAVHVLPPAIAVAMRPGGGIDVAAVLRSLAAQPRQIPDLARTIAGFARAMAALKRGAAQAGPVMARGIA